MLQIGVFGGAFNPPHKGHERLARHFADKLALDKVLVIPSFLPPHKDGAHLASGADRITMCRLAFAGDDRFEASAAEIDRGGKSYTYDTLLALRGRWPGARFYLIIGADMLASFKTWRRWEDILAMCTLCAAARDKRGLPGDTGIDAVVSDLPPFEVSSTAIRDRIKNRQDISGLVDDEVARYIAVRGLYLD